MELVHEEALQFHNIGQEAKCTKLVFLRNKTTNIDVIRFALQFWPGLAVKVQMMSYPFNH